MKKKEAPIRKLKNSLHELRADVKQLDTDNSRLEKELLAALEIKRNTRSFVIYKKTNVTKGEVVPIVLASDWHIEEEVKKMTVNGLNEYSLTIAAQRSENFFKNALRLIEKERSDSKMSTVCLALLGDFISGNIHEPLLPICKLQPMQAILFVQDLLISGIEFLRKNTKLELIIPCTVGNHTRITDKVWIATEQGYSLEYLMYHNMARHFKNDPKVKFIIAEGQHCYIDFFKYRIRFLHGTQFRYMQGIGGFTIPIMKKIQKWDVSIPAYYTFCGHLHQLFDGNPRFLVNGSLIGYNTFAMAIGAEFQRPVQSMIILSEKHGKAGVSPIFVD
jgi:hypothetical protein